MPPRATVFVNAASGPDGQPPLAERLAELFAAHGWQPNGDVRVLPVHGGCDLVEMARQAVAEGYPTLVAAGGDGTVNAVANTVAATEANLGVLPLGTLNHFAKDVGIPLDLEQAVQTIVAGHVQAVDVGEVNGRLFVNNSSVGLYPTIVHRRDAHQRLGKGKWSSFLRAMLTVLGRYPLVRVAIRADGQQIVRRTPLVFVGNNEYHNHGMKLGTRERLDAGALSVCLTRDIGRLKLCAFALLALLGRLRDARDFDELQTTELVITSRRAHLRVATDGEVCRLRTPLEYRIRPGALRVLVPRPEPHDAASPTAGQD